MILVIDNYDSFTYNLVQLLGELNCDVKVFRNDKISLKKIAKLSPKAIVLSPGPCSPNEAGISVSVVENFAEKIPVLGVCLGHQCIGRAFGGKIIKAPFPVHGKISKIFHDGKTIFEKTENPFNAARYHSLVVDSKNLPSCFEVSATSGDGLIMGLRHKKFSVEGIQFHPESFKTACGKKILKNFLKISENFWKKSDF